MARDAETPDPSRSAVFPSLTAELIFAANAVASRPGSRQGIDPTWLDRQRDEMPPKALAFIPSVAEFWWPTRGLIDFLCHNGQYQDPGAFLDQVGSQDIDEFLSILFNGDITPSQARTLRARPQGVDELGGRLSRFSEGSTAALRAVFDDAEAHRKGLLALVKGADTPWFRETYARLAAEALPFVRTLEKRLSAEPPLAVAEELRGKPLHGPRTYESYTFVPSRLIGHRHIQCWNEQQTVFFLQEGVIHAPRPSEVGAELAEFLKSLGDKTRMDILRLICCGPSYGKEIAENLGLTTATVSRHLDQLKAAGLIREDRAENNIKRLRYVPEVLDGQLERLRNYLLHS